MLGVSKLTGMAIFLKQLLNTTTVPLYKCVTIHIEKGTRWHFQTGNDLLENRCARKIMQLPKFDQDAFSNSKFLSSEYASFKNWEGEGT